jgi:hypothetical protein
MAIKSTSKALYNMYTSLRCGSFCVSIPASRTAHRLVVGDPSLGFQGCSTFKCAKNFWLNLKWVVSLVSYVSKISLI